MKALVADDEPQLAAFLCERLKALWPELEIVGVAGNGPEALALAHAHRPDLAFLDIRMPGMSGLEVAAELAGGGTRVVFVTAFDQFALEAFEHHAVDYLLKPVTDARLESTIRHLRASAPAAGDAELTQLARELSGFLSARQAARGPLRWIRAGQNESVRQVNVDDVLYFKSADKYTIVTVREDGQESELLIRLSLSELAEQLDGEVFWQIHRGTLVNLRHVTGTRRDVLGKLYVQIRGHRHELPVSRQYAHRFRQM